MTLPFRPALRLAFATALASVTTLTVAAPAAAPGLRLTGVTSSYSAGDKVGAIQSGQDCADTTAREWSDLLQRRVNIELTRAFDAEAGRAGASEALAVSARLNDLKLQLCDLGRGAWQGGFEVRMSWQLKRRDGTGPALQASTSGQFQHRPGEPGICPADALREAMAQAVRQLLADPKVAAALRPPAGADRQVALGD